MSSGWNSLFATPYRNVKVPDLFVSGPTPSLASAHAWPSNMARPSRATRFVRAVPI